jgi:hypothetical protein
MSDLSRARFLYNYQAICLTVFGDIKPVDLRMNDSYIYESVHNKPTILGKYPISSIVDIILPVFREHRVALIFESN